MGAMASQITSITTVYSTVFSGADQRKLQSSTSLAVVRGIHWWPVNSLHKWPGTRKMFPFDDVIMFNEHCVINMLYLRITRNTPLNSLGIYQQPVCILNTIHLHSKNTPSPPFYVHSFTFHSWLRHQLKSLANRLTPDPKIVIHGHSCITIVLH